MKFFQWFAGFLCAISFILILLITSVEVVAYGSWDYYKTEYEKYGVLDDVNMKMEDLMEVTKEMMAYLRGNRPDLHIVTTIAGQEREFFNEREIAHMEDVRELFLGALVLRRVCVVVLLLSVLFLGIFFRPRLKRLLARSFQWSAGLLCAVVILLGILFATDFTKYFTIFHEIFFTNDLWLLNPSTDLLINIVPEPFFVDTAFRIGLIFGIVVLALFGLSTFYCCRKSKNNI